MNNNEAKELYKFWKNHAKLLEKKMKHHARFLSVILIQEGYSDFAKNMLKYTLKDRKYLERAEENVTYFYMVKDEK